MKYKKQRGQQRKLDALIENMNLYEPFKDTTVSYERFSVPSGRFISSPKTSAKIKTAFCKAWLEKTDEIIKKKPLALPFCKVVSIINTEDLWKSQIVAFYDIDYYNSFWTRDTEEQKWKPIEDKTVSFVRERNIKTDLNEKCYIETISEVDFCKKTMLWFYGDI